MFVDRVVRSENAFTDLFSGPRDIAFEAQW